MRFSKKAPLHSSAVQLISKCEYYGYYRFLRKPAMKDNISFRQKKLGARFTYFNCMDQNNLPQKQENPARLKVSCQSGAILARNGP